MARIDRERRGQKLARGLAFFSIGLGVAELLAPRKVANIAGLRRPDKKWIRGFGAREIASGISILAKPRSASAVWSRVAGDALDLAGLGLAFTSARSRKTRLAIATANVAAITALDVICARRLARSGPVTSRRPVEQMA